MIESIREMEAHINVCRSHLTGRMAADSGSYQQAARQYQLALDIARENELGESLIARAMSGLARAYGGIGRIKESEDLLRQAIRIDEANSEPNLVALATDRLQLAAILRQTGRYEEAEQVSEQVLASLEHLPEAPVELTVSFMRQLAIVLLETGKPDDCQRLVERALDITASHSELGRHSLAYGQLLAVKVLVLIDQERFDEARELYNEAMQIMNMERGPDHPRNVDLKRIIAKHWQAAGQPDMPS